MTMPPRAARFFLLCLTFVGCFCAGCQLPQLLEATFPTEEVKAVYDLPKEKTVLVFPDDLTNPVSYPPLKRELAENISAFLKENKVVADVIPYQRLADLQANDPNFNRMSIGTIGRKLGVDYVIYINIELFTLKEAAEDTVWHPNMEGRVRVVDVSTGKRTWPDESAGYPFKCGLPMMDSTSPYVGGELTKLLCNKAGTEICQLFYKHTERRARPTEKETELDH
jgi:hypothetical protein